LGLVTFCAYVLFDTQMIIEKSSNGYQDFVLHALDLFLGKENNFEYYVAYIILTTYANFIMLDFVSIFVRILIILMRNAEKNNKKKERESRR